MKSDNWKLVFEKAESYSFETFVDFKVLKVRVSEYFKYPSIMSDNKTVR